MNFYNGRLCEGGKLHYPFLALSDPQCTSIVCDDGRVNVALNGKLVEEVEGLK